MKKGIGDKVLGWFVVQEEDAKAEEKHGRRIFTAGRKT